MEVCRQEPVAEGVKSIKQQAKETPQTSGKKKAKLKKKKASQDDAGKEPGQNKKPIFLTSPLDLLQLYSNAGAQDDTPKVNSGRRASTPLSTASSTISLVAEGIVTQSNESLRWNGILDDPVAEEERLSSYRLNRRQRYNACLQKSLPPEPSLTLKHLPQLCKVAHLKGEQTSGKSKPSDSLSVANKNQNYSPNSKLMTKT